LKYALPTHTLLRGDRTDKKRGLPATLLKFPATTAWRIVV